MSQEATAFPRGRGVGLGQARRQAAEVSPQLNQLILNASRRQQTRGEGPGRGAQGRRRRAGSAQAAPIKLNVKTPDALVESNSRQTGSKVQKYAVRRGHPRCEHTEGESQGRTGGPSAEPKPQKAAGQTLRLKALLTSDEENRFITTKSDVKDLGRPLTPLTYRPRRMTLPRLEEHRVSVAHGTFAKYRSRFGT